MSTWQPAGLPGRERDTKRVGEFLDRVTASIGAPKAHTLSAVFSGWEELVGSEIASHAAPRSLRDGVLTVEVDEPAWAAQLGFLSSQLLAKLQTEAGSEELSEIRFRVTGAGARTGRGRDPQGAWTGPLKTPGKARRKA